MKQRSLVSSITMIMTVVSIILSSCGNNDIKADVTVPNYYALSAFYFDGDFKEFYLDSYNWYKSIEGKDGVYLVNTTYYNDEALQAWRDNNLYDAVPDNAFWVFCVSPSYLEQMNIDVVTDEIDNARNGVRLYLIPDTLPDSETENMERYLRSDALKHAPDSDIKTTFTENLEVKIIQYTPSEKHFTFPSLPGQELETTAPVIYVCTSENMKYFESESLIATGIDSYIKFIDRDTMQKYTADTSMDLYSLNFAKLSDIYREASKNKLVDRGIESIFN